MADTAMKLPYAELAEKALRAAEKSYAPYSGFTVGAALLTEEGKLYTGVNIENAAFSPTICAERTAFAKAVSEGERKFSAIAVAGFRKDARENERGFAYPCGVCRQVMAEFCEPDSFLVIVAKSCDDFRVHTLSELLPHGFYPASLNI